MGKFSTVSFKEILKERIEKVLGKKETAFNAIILETIEDVLKKQEIIKKICSHLEFKSVSDSGMIIKDKHTNKLVEVSFKDKRFWCSECLPKFCIHNTFACLHLKTGHLVDQDGLQ